jgi:serine/threonine protein kinase
MSAPVPVPAEDSDRTLAAPAETAAPTRLGAWTIERHLGAGAMGEVFLGRRADGERAALKLVSPRFASDRGYRDRFRREIGVLMRLDHRGIARALEHGEHAGRPWLAIEFVDGHPLDEILSKHGPFTTAEALAIAADVARGLAYIYNEAGLVHRDVKPANILIGRDGATKLIDFGLAKPQEAEDIRLTMTGMILGTPNYIAPEQVRCETLGPYSDQYALGGTLFHLLTGRRPYQRNTAAATMAAHLSDPVPDPGELAPTLAGPVRELVRTALAKDPRKRFPDWRAFIVACEKASTVPDTGQDPQRATTRLLVVGQAGSPVTNRVVRQPVPTTSTLRRIGTGSVNRQPATGRVLSAAASGEAALREATSRHQRKQGETPGVVAAIPPPPGAVPAATPPPRPALAATPPPRPALAAAPSRPPPRPSEQLSTHGLTGGSRMPFVVLGIAVVLVVAGGLWYWLRGAG